MDQKEYIEKVCKHCINENNCKKDHIKIKSKDTFYSIKCYKYQNIFDCCSKKCSSCGRCGVNG